MASVLLLYYHLLNEGGITNDQTVYLDPNDFNGFDYLGVEVNELANESLDLDEDLIREGAIIYLLCDLNDIIGEYDADFHGQPQAKRIVEALNDHKSSPIPEVALLLKQVSVPEGQFNYSEYNKILQVIYKKHVHGLFAKKLA
ncbi:hypothetical protein SAMN05216575_11392 [Ectopseudomonas alcaliphila]|nr:hypothetical protein SAMN05216575_11392 [Pseudomonas alcaliphila]